MQHQNQHQNLLIVEDNEAQRVVLTDMMQEEGFDVVACATGSAALEAVASQEFAIAIVDERLPDMRGTELLERAGMERRGIRAIMHTGYATFESARDAINHRVFAYVEKMGRPEELVRQVHRAAQDWMASALVKREDEFRQLLESVQAVVWRSKPDLLYNTYVSREAESLLGYSVEQWLTEPHFWENHIHPDDVGWVVEGCAEATRKKESHQFEYRMVAADGRTVWMRDIINVLVEDGEPVELVGVMVDITERKLAEQALRESEEKNRALLQAMPDALFRMSLEGVYLEYIPAKDFETFVSPEAFLNRTISEVMPEPLAAQLMACLEGVRDSKQMQQCEYELVLQGAVRYFEARFVPQGEQEALVIVRDITERRRAEAALRESEERNKKLLHTMLDGYVLTDASGQILEVNQAYASTVGYTADELLGMNIRALDTARSEEEVGSSIQQFITEGTAQFETQHRHKTGRLVDLEGSITVMTVQGQTVVAAFMRDITDRKQAAESLRQSEARYRAVLETQTELISRSLPDTTLTFVNEAYCAYFGKTAEELIGRSFLDFVVPEHREQTYAHFRSLVEEPRMVAHLHEVVLPDGSKAWQEWYDRPLLDEKGKVVEFQSVGRDVTERRRAEETLRASEKSFRLMFAQNPIPMWVYHQKTLAFLDVNQAAINHYGYSKQEFLSMTIHDLSPGDKLAGVHLRDATLHDGLLQGSEWKHRKKDGTLIDVEITVQSFLYGEQPSRLVLANDITERRRLEREILEISGREQRRIGQDLHDELGQLLTGIGFRVEALAGDLEEADLPLVEDVADIGRLVERSIVQTRALARGLNPVNVEQQGLPAALRELSLHIGQIYGITCTFTSTQPMRVRDQGVATHVYRIAQEAINNAIKHAQATTIDISLDVDQDRMVLTVCDNGRGMPAVSLGSGMGLRIMAFRARMIGGTFEIHPGEAGGTTVVCHFPDPLMEETVE